MINGWEMNEVTFEGKLSNNLILSVLKEGEDEEVFKLRATDVLKGFLENNQFETSFKTHLFSFCFLGSKTFA